MHILQMCQSFCGETMTIGTRNALHSVSKLGLRLGKECQNVYQSPISTGNPFLQNYWDYIEVFGHVDTLLCELSLSQSVEPSGKFFPLHSEDAEFSVARLHFVPA